MLKILKDLKPFFEDNYKRIHVRDYAKIQNISPPTASKLLEELKKEKLLKKIIDKKHYLFFANKDSKDFIDLQRLYYRIKLNDLIEYIKNETINPIIILFGSLSKAEAKQNSDFDIVILTPTDKKLNVEIFEKKLKRTIQLFQFKNIDDIPKELKQNILNGYNLKGEF